MNWFYLILAIVFEVSGTASMKFSEGFTRTTPSILMFVFYLLSLISLNLTLKTIDVSIAYAVWSGLGTALIALIGIFYFKEPLTLFKVISIVFIIIGVMGLNLGQSAKDLM